MAGLIDLPNELLSLIAENLERPRDLTHLAQTCRILNKFVIADGWKRFAKGRFNIPPSDAKNTIHGLTTLYRNWDRKAFVACSLPSWNKVRSLHHDDRPIRDWNHLQRQSMGWQPRLDSYEEGGVGGIWAERREVLAWSAGTSLMIRVQETGPNIHPIDRESDEFQAEERPMGPFKTAKHYSYRIPGGHEGRDDIVDLKFLRPHQKNTPAEQLVFGTASGGLSMLTAPLERGKTIEQQFETNGHCVRAVSISPAVRPLMAASFTNSDLVLYDLSTQNDQFVKPISHTAIVQTYFNPRVWSSNFISDDKFAVGLGPSDEPLEVYQARPDGLVPMPLRKFRMVDNDTGQRATSVYSIIPIPTQSQGGSASNNVFLSGGFDGLVKLHDMRSPRNVDTIFWDVTNDASIYSLVCQGTERFIAGTSMHCMLKVFDLRFPGSHAYHHIPIPTKPLPKRQDYTYNAVIENTKGSASIVTGGWNVYLSPRPARQHPGYPQRQEPRGPSDSSPVYSLSLPSATSPNLYAGLENMVENLTFTSVLDRHPDPLFSHLRAPYYRQHEVLNLSMYEQGDQDHLNMHLLVQDNLTDGLADNLQKMDLARKWGLDERWKDPSSDRWVRGQAPPSNARRSGHRRGRARSGRGAQRNM